MVVVHFEVEFTSPGDEQEKRVLRHMARELLLMQGSDWPFLLFTVQAKEYTNERFHYHHQLFRKLICAAGGLGDHQRISDDDLGQVENIDFVWPRIDYTLFPHREGPWT
jgi:1,4-alpha-glucan branching enzyme